MFASFLLEIPFSKAVIMKPNSLNFIKKISSFSKSFILYIYQNSKHQIIYNTILKKFRQRAVSVFEWAKDFRTFFLGQGLYSILRFSDSNFSFAVSLNNFFKVIIKYIWILFGMILDIFCGTYFFTSLSKHVKGSKKKRCLH